MTCKINSTKKITMIVQEVEISLPEPSKVDEIYPDVDQAFKDELNRLQLPADSEKISEINISNISTGILFSDGMMKQTYKITFYLKDQS